MARLPTEAPARLQPTPGNALRGSSVLGLVELASLASGFLLQLVVARVLSAPDYGRFAVLSMVELGLLVPLVGGVPQALRHLVSLNPGNLPEAVRWVVRVQLPLSIGVALLLATGATPIGRLMRDPAISASLRLLSFAVLIRCGFLEPSLLLFNGVQRHTTQAVLGVSYHLLRIACVAYAVRLADDLPGAILGLILATMLAATLSVALVWRLRRATPDAADGDFAAQARAWIGLAPAYELFSFLPVASNLWLVKILVSDQRLVGAYAACFMLARASSALSRAAVGGTFAPLAIAFSRVHTASARAIVAGATRAILLLLIPACAFAMTRGEVLVRLLYGSKYDGSESFAGVLFAGACGTVLQTFYGGVLGAAGALRSRLSVATFLGIASVLTSAELVRLAGTNGAAWAWLLTGAGGAMAMYRLVRALVGPFLPWASLLRASVAALSMIAFGSCVRLNVASELLVGALSYGGSLFLLGEWTVDDRRPLLSLFRSFLPSRRRGRGDGTKDEAIRSNDGNPGGKE